MGSSPGPGASLQHGDFPMGEGAGLVWGLRRQGARKVQIPRLHPRPSTPEFLGLEPKKSGFSQCSQRVLRKVVPHRGFGTSPRTKMHQFCNSRFSVSKRLQLHNSKKP